MSKIKEVRLYGISSSGKTHLIGYLEGERLTQRQAILAKCCECMGYHADGQTAASLIVPYISTCRIGRKAPCGKIPAMKVRNKRIMRDKGGYVVKKAFPDTFKGSILEGRQGMDIRRRPRPACGKPMIYKNAHGFT